MSRFGDLLIKYRRRAKLTQKELGKKVGVDDSYISRLEREVYKPPSREVAEGLADATSMSNKPVTLYVSTKDMNGIDRFVFLLEANVAGAEDVKEIRLVKIEDDETDEEEDQSSAGLIPSIAHAAKPIPEALFGTTGEEIDYLTESAGLTEEEEEKAAVEVIEFYKRLLTLIKTLRKREKN